MYGFNEKYNLERLVKDGAVTYPCDDEDKPGNEVIFEGLSTDNKRKTCTSKTISDNV